MKFVAPYIGTHLAYNKLLHYFITDQPVLNIHTADALLSGD